LWNDQECYITLHNVSNRSTKNVPVTFAVFWRVSVTIYRYGNVTGTIGVTTEKWWKMTNEPKSEQETIVLFTELCPELGAEIISISTKAHIDATVRWRNKGDLAVEFEYMASSFIKHKHKKEQCDLIVCWKNDDLKKKITVPIFSIYDYFEWKKMKEIEKHKTTKKIVKWFLFLYMSVRFGYFLINGDIDPTNKTTVIFIGQLLFIALVYLFLGNRLKMSNENA
jgi:hypothetical protein